MKSKHALAALFLTLTGHSTCIASERFAVVGDGILYALAEPSGWKMDTESGTKDGLPAVYYPSGQSWNSATTVMYTNMIGKNCQANHDLPSFIAAEVNLFRKRDPKIVITDGGNIEADGHQAIVKVYSSARYSNYEAVAYIAEKNSFISITLSAKSRKQYNDSFATFKRLVSSYQYISGLGTCSSSANGH